jgi:GMP synthase (glutamine-hydrolysing)
LSAPALRFLIADSEPPKARAERRDSVGQSSGETYLDTLRELMPDALFERMTPADRGAELKPGAALAGYDAVFLTGSPLHLYEDTPETRREVAFMREVFASGTPAFGSCAGLQLATAAAGGTLRPSARGPEAAFARRITPTEAGLRHPLLAGRPEAFDALAFHSDEVDTLPDDATLLATNDMTRVQAIEIKSGQGTFWGVQYHPELSLHEIAAALRRQADDLIHHDLAPDRDAVEKHADLVDLFDSHPGGLELARRLRVDPAVADPKQRTIELRNFVNSLVIPTRSVRGRS